MGSFTCGFYTDMKSMYLADSESSSIRRVDLTTGGSKLLAGGDPTFSDNLFQVPLTDQYAFTTDMGNSVNRHGTFRRIRIQ